MVDQGVILQMRADGTWVERLNNIIVKRPDESKSVLELAAAEGSVDILAWISHHAVGLVEEYTPENMNIYHKIKAP